MLKLSAREQEVLILYLKEGRLRPVAQTLGLSVHTIRHQRASAMKKLGVHNSTQLTRTAIEKGLVKS
jgi:DNA-binding NarL/FixJ family response regulator